MARGTSWISNICGGGAKALSYVEAGPRSANHKARIHRLLKAMGDTPLSHANPERALELKRKLLGPDAAPGTYIRAIIMPMRAIPQLRAKAWVVRRAALRRAALEQRPHPLSISGRGRAADRRCCAASAAVADFSRRHWGSCDRSRVSRLARCRPSRRLCYLLS
jgi:hypothetical protein